MSPPDNGNPPGRDFQRPPRGGRGKRRGGRKGVKHVEDGAPDVSPELLERLAATLEGGEYIVFDIETTGGNPEKNGITEIFAVRYKDQVPLDTFYSMVNPGIPIPPIVRRMTGIDNKMVRNAPKIGEVMPGFCAFAGNAVLVSHNTIGDMKFLRHFAKTAADVTMDNFFCCTHLLVEKLAPEAPDKSLKGLAEFFDLARGELHRAEADTWITLELFKVLVGRLKAKNVKTIHEAVRLQGDLESGLRLGWAVPEASLQNVPQGPGVFYLYDHDRKPLFLCAATHLDREVEKLKVFSQLPRQLLKIIFRTYDLGTVPAPNLLQALLDECTALESHKIAFDPMAYHQRAVTALTVSRDPAGKNGEPPSLRLEVGPVQAGALHAFGPVRDRRVAGELLQSIGNAYGAKMVRDAIRLPIEAETHVMKLLEGQLDQVRAELERRARSIKLWFKPSERKSLKTELGVVSKLAAAKVPAKLSPLLDKHGVILVPDGGALQAHLVVGTRPRTVTKLAGDPDAATRRRFAEEIKAQIATVMASPLSAVEAARINAVLWWLYGGGKDGRVLTMEELV